LLRIFILQLVCGNFYVETEHLGGLEVDVPKIKEHSMHTRKMLLSSLACAVAFAISESAAAQVYPARPITMVVPFPAGGPTDVIARIVADRMRGLLGQPIIIENVTGCLRQHRRRPCR
jgi:hypothetical protein